MKKISVLIIFILVMACITGCQPKDDIGVEKLYYQAPTMEQFIADWTAESPDELLLSPYDTVGSCILIPELVSADWELSLVEVNEYSFFYYYVPSDDTENPKSMSSEIVISVSRSNGSYQGVMEQYDLVPQEGFAYYEKPDTWIMNNDGKRVSISFPENVNIGSAKEIETYFLFKTVGGE